LRDLSNRNVIPSEILEFFNVFPGQSLLIKGKPGTGKTILALTILREICEKGNGLYVSTRLEPKRLYLATPWIRQFIPERNVIDATQSRIWKTLELKHKDKKTVDYEVILEFFKAIYDDAEDMDNPIIIFDSWDGVLSHLKLSEEASALTQGICDFCREVETHTIFVAEREEQTSVDFIVDGVVTLRRLKLAETEHRLIREIEIEKLRGLPVRQCTYLFTLYGGEFRYFEPFTEDLRVEGRVIPDISHERLSTGIKDLDHVIGGFKRGSFNLWELSFGVNRRYEQLLLQLCKNRIRKGEGVAGIPPMGSILDRAQIENLLLYKPETGDVNVETSSFLSIIRNLYEKTGRPVLIFVSIDTLEKSLGPSGTLDFLDDLVKISEETGIISAAVYLMNAGSPVSNAVVNSIDTHLVFRDINGALVLYGVRPVTSLYGITTGGEGINLTPIM